MNRSLAPPCKFPSEESPPRPFPRISGGAQPAAWRPSPALSPSGRITPALPRLAAIGIFLLHALISPLAAQSFGDFIYFTQDGAIRITAYTGAGGAVTIPDTIDGLPVTNVGGFKNNTAVTSVTIGNNVTTIDFQAFSECRGLTSVSIPDSITSIGLEAFYGCTSLESVSIPDGVTSIESRAFQRCSGLTSVTLPKGLTSLGTLVFSSCTALTSVTIPDGIRFIPTRMFQYCIGLTSVAIPESVTSIEEYAFYGCIGLTTVSIPDNVTRIGTHAFLHCAGLTSVSIPAGVTSIGNTPFIGCTALLSLEVAAGNTAYRSVDGVLFNAAQTTLIQYPAARAGSYDIPADITSIEASAFRYSSGLTNVTIPNSVTSIGAWAFSGCNGLTSVGIPDSVRSIGTLTFQGCSGLTGVTIPASVTSIGAGPFASCTSLLSIEVEEGNTAYRSVDGALFDAAQTTLIQYPAGKTGGYTIPAGVTSIDAHAFSDCRGLTSVTIPDSVTSIGSLVFSGCSGLTSIVIPASVTFLDLSAFWACPELSSITFEGDAPSFIGNSYPDFTAYYYKGSTGFDPPPPEWELPKLVALTRPSDADGHPEIAALRRESGRFSVDVAGRAGWTYELQRKLSLVDATWQPAATRGPLTANQGFELTDPDATGDEAIYRVQASPP